VSGVGQDTVRCFQPFEKYLLPPTSVTLKPQHRTHYLITPNVSGPYRTRAQRAPQKSSSTGCTYRTRPVQTGCVWSTPDACTESLANWVSTWRSHRTRPVSHRTRPVQHRMRSVHTRCLLRNFQRQCPLRTRYTGHSGCTVPASGASEEADFHRNYLQLLPLLPCANTKVSQHLCMCVSNFHKHFHGLID